MKELFAELLNTLDAVEMLHGSAVYYFFLQFFFKIFVIVFLHIFESVVF